MGSQLVQTLHRHPVDLLAVRGARVDWETVPTREVTPLSVAFAPCPDYSQNPPSRSESRLDGCSPHWYIEETVDAVGRVWKEAVSCKSAVDVVAVAGYEEGWDSPRMVSCCRHGTSPYLIDNLPAVAGSDKRVADMLD